jgi:predicted secreted hydrolase
LVRRRAFLGVPLVLVAQSSPASSFPPVVRGRSLAFPRDHGSHPDYRNEWWYVTGLVHDAGGRELGVQVTFFRNRPGVAESGASRFAPRQLMFAHAAIADPAHGRLRHDQRSERAVFDLAGADETTTRTWLRDWSLTLDGDSYIARIAARDFALDLRFRATQPVLLQGDGGYSRKGPLPIQASYYYSRPQLETAGTIVVDGRAREVSGRAWLDHEWSSEYMAEQAVGWDWIGINLDDGGALMAFRMRDRMHGAVWAGGARRDGTGATQVFGPEAVRFSPGRRWTSPRTSIIYPVEFEVHAGGVDYSILPMMDDQELDSLASTATIYWEGAVRVTRAGRPAGRGYLELTGYGGALKI